MRYPAAEKLEIIRLVEQSHLLVRPSLRRPPSRSACLTQPWIVAAHGSNSLARSTTLRPARASATICSLNSGGYGFLVFGI